MARTAINRNMVKNVFSWVCLGALELLHVPKPLVTILGYHTVSEDNTVVDITPAAFVEQISYLISCGYEFISLDDLHQYRQGKKELSKPAVVLTFDDGYADLLAFAAPFLAEKKIPATYYVVSHPRRIDRQLLQNQKPIVHTLALKRLSQLEGATIGAHTTGHYNVSTLSGNQAKEDFVDCKKTLEKVVGKPVVHFAYPWGQASDEAPTGLMETGYVSSVTTQIGFYSREDNPYLLPRIMVDRTHSFSQFRFMLTPLYPWIVALLAFMPPARRVLGNGKRFALQGV